MIKREKAITLPVKYQVAFETCVRTLEQYKIRNDWGVKQFVKVKSANPQTGIITARFYGRFRFDISLQTSENQTTINTQLISRRGISDPLGSVQRMIDDFLDAFMKNLAPYITNAALPLPSTTSGAIASSAYKATPVGYNLAETHVGTATQWVRLVIVIFIVIGIIGALLAAVSSASH